MRLTSLVGSALCGMLCIPQVALPCSRTSPVSASEMIRGADAIVRGVASEYVVAPADPNVMTTGVPDSRIRFNVLEVIRGQGIGKEIILPGYLSDRDDFNDQSAPYSFVRPNGRSGSCFANTYRAGAQFLLVLKQTKDGGYTVNSTPLSRGAARRTCPRHRGFRTGPRSTAGHRCHLRQSRCPRKPPTRPRRTAAGTGSSWSPALPVSARRSSQPRRSGRTSSPVGTDQDRAAVLG